MALVKCKECDSEVSDEARRCPSCGVMIKSYADSVGRSAANGCLIVIGFILFGFILWIFL